MPRRQPLQQREGAAAPETAPVETPRLGVEGEEADPVAQLQADDRPAAGPR